MEGTRPIPAGGVAPGLLSALTGRRGPVLTASLRLDPAQPDATYRAELAWRAAREEAERRGAPPGLLAAAGERFAAAGRTDDQLVLVADADGVLFARATDAAPTGVRWQAAPWFAPVLTALQEDIDHAVVVADRAGASVRVHRRGREFEMSPGGDTHPLHKVPGAGWSHRRAQQRVEETWRANAAEVAEAVTDLLRSDRVEVVALGGDERAVALIRDDLPPDVGDRVALIPATRAAGGDDQAEARAVRQALAEVADRRTLALLAAVRDRRPEGGAADGADEVLAALRGSQVGLLLAGDTGEEGGPAVPYVPGRPDLVGARDLPGAEEAAACPLVDAAVAAAVETGAEVRLLPAEAGAGGPRLHALLRWDRET